MRRRCCLLAGVVVALVVLSGTTQAAQAPTAFTAEDIAKVVSISVLDVDFEQRILAWYDRYLKKDPKKKETSTQ
jgi:hypothetical protein